MREFALTIYRHQRAADLLKRFAETEVRLLYELLERDMPYVPADYGSSMHEVGPGEMVGRLRDTLLRELVHRGTREALHELRALQIKRPDLTFLDWYVGEARQKARDNKWSNVPWSEVQKILDGRSSRILQTEDDLLTIVDESVKRFEKSLQGISGSLDVVERL